MDEDSRQHVVWDGTHAVYVRGMSEQSFCLLQVAFVSGERAACHISNAAFWRSLETLRGGLASCAPFLALHVLEGEREPRPLRLRPDLGSNPRAAHARWPLPEVRGESLEIIENLKRSVRCAEPAIVGIRQVDFAICHHGRTSMHDRLPEGVDLHERVKRPQAGL